MKVNVLIKIIVIVSISIFLIIFGVFFGSQIKNLNDIVQIILHKIFKFDISDDIPKTLISIIWDIRIPRVLLSFLVGGMLSVSGGVIQSVLRNPLASPYTIGISSGSSLGIGLAIVLDIVFIFQFKYFIYPIIGFIFSIITTIFVIYLSKKIDKYMINNTIILIGMVISLFLNAILTLVTSIKKESIPSLLIWQMGSFSSRGWDYLISIIPFFLISFLGIMFTVREIDILTLGDEMGNTIGVNIKNTKIKLLIFSSILTGASISSSGIIGFIDLITPHMCRKLFGFKNIIVIPMSMIFGGALMVFFDIIARSIVYPSEIPISTVNALIGAPIFCYIFFKSNRG